ncbi:MAG TPA: ABC transporter permease [Bacteroidales bacterium]|nr:ABC transporter permease [Bacteroidales bacterium]
MNLENFIAKRLMNKSSGSGNLSRPFIRITTIAVALSLSIMIISVAVVTGFKKEISEKTIGFGSHIQILNYDGNRSYETKPINENQECLPKIKALNGIRHIQKFALKPGIIKTENDIQGVVIKGIAPDFDWSFFKKSLVDGDIFELSDTITTNKVLISKTLSLLLRLKVGDKFSMYFVQDPPRARVFTISGIYDTKMSEFDKVFILGDIRHVQKLNDWKDDQITGFEILVDDFDKIEDLTMQVDDIAGLIFFEDGSRLKVQSIIEKYPTIFDWLNLQDMNAIVLIVIMVIVAGINMVSGLLIIILERTKMIGVLKAMGAENPLIRRVFLIQSGFIIIRGLIFGNLFGLALCIIQQQFGIIKLDEASYYLATVPIHLNVIHILLLNIGTFLITIAMLVIPSMVISRISPEKTIKFD